MRPYADRHLYFQVLVAIATGALIGHFWPQTGEALKPLGDGFIKLVKMIISPVIFLTITTGLAGMGSLKGVGSVAGKAFAYFLFFSTLALIVGLIVANVVQPGAGMNIDPATLDTSSVAGYASKAHETSLIGFALDIFPATFTSAFVEGNILQVLFVSIIFGVSLILVGEKAKPVVSILEAVSTVVFRTVDVLMKAAPIGAFAFTIGKYGIASVVNLAALVGTFYLTSALFIFVVLGTVARMNGFSILRLMVYLKAELLLVAMLSSKGAAGVTGAGFITLAATLSVVPTVPVAGIAIILGVDRFMSECRSLTNFIGNEVATIVVSRWEGALDRDRLNSALGGEPMPDAAVYEKLRGAPAGLQLGEASAD